MLMICVSQTETYLFDYVGFWVKRAGNDVSLNFGVAAVEITIHDPKLLISDLLEELAKKKVTKIEADKRVTIQVVESEKEEEPGDEPSDEPGEYSP